jgi:hypothetical protein
VEYDPGIDDWKRFELRRKYWREVTEDREGGSDPDLLLLANIYIKKNIRHK